MEIKNQSPILSSKIEKKQNNKVLKVESNISSNTIKKDSIEVTNIKKGEIRNNLKLSTNENEKLINKFSDNPITPYTKESACNVAFRSIINNTSVIQDYECSDVYSKTPKNLAQDIFSHEKVKNDPELKSKLEKFVSLLDSYDKSALAYTKTLLERNPSISNDTTKTILDKLSNMMNENYDSRIGDKKSFVISALHDISMPTDISQEEIGTCAGTSVQIQLAIRNPIEYLNMIDKLAKNESYISVKGISIPPNFSFANEGGNNHDSKRTISAKIMQNTIMDYADGSERNYDSSKKDEGITTEQTAKALNDIVGLNLKNVHAQDYTSNQLMFMLKQSKPTLENPIEISLSYEKEGRDTIHSVSITYLDNNNVTIANPWGREETFPISELEKRILSVSYLSSIKEPVIEIDIKDPNLLESLSDDSKKDQVIHKISIKDQFSIIENTFSPWDGSKYAINTNMSSADKKIIVNLLDELTKGDYAQYNSIIYKIKHFCPDLNLFISKIDNNTDQFKRVKTKLLDLGS